MGVNINVYGIFGVRINDYDDDLSEAYNKVYGDPDIPTIVFDGMSGEYIVMGEMIYDSGDFRYDEAYGIAEVDPATLAEMETKYKIHFRNVFPDFAHYMDEPFKLHMFVHYS